VVSQHNVASRTGASRRQRRRQRRLAVPNGVPSAEEIEEMRHAVEGMQNMRRELQAAQDEPEVQLWPPTPESTPPSSPRAIIEHSGNQEAQASAVVADSESDQLIMQLEKDAAQRPYLLQWLTGCVWSMASTAGGSRVIQKAFEVADQGEQVALTDQLRGHVREAAASPHANHVLQKAIELLPPERLDFVLTEMKGHGVTVARHRYGCRVLERLIEHCPNSQTCDLVNEVLSGTEQLCRHSFGNFVVQHILEHGTPLQRKQVADVLEADIVRLAKHRVASHVVRCALVHCDGSDRQRLKQAILKDPEEHTNLAHHHCGSFVVREMRRVGHLEH